MSGQVVSSAALPVDVRAILGEDVEYCAPSEGNFERDELLAHLEKADALISLLGVCVDEELMARAPRLRIVANFAVGFDNVDVSAATARGIVVTNTPDVLTDATADFSFALLLAAARRIVEGDRLARSGEWTGWAPGQLLGADVAGRTLGIVGMGRIGQAVARRARGFDMPVLYVSPAAVRMEGARRVERDELLSTSDFVSLHCPLSPATERFIDATALAAMKSSAILVNTSRGGCVDEAALARALSTGEIAAAGLDVFDSEPKIHPDLAASDRVVLAPHAGSATTTARTRMAQICATNVSACLAGRRPDTPVNPEVLEGRR
jgi:glyoxylate reductase